MNNLQFEIKLYLDGTVLRILEFEIKLYLDDTVLRILEFEIELYLVRQLLEDTEGYTWIGTNIKGFIGVGHSLQK